MQLRHSRKYDVGRRPLAKGADGKASAGGGLGALVTLSMAMLIAVGGLTGLASSARAEFTICNQSLDVFNVAIGYDRPDGFQTEGWWVIGANRCVDVITEPLPTRYVYIYVQDVFGRSAIQGSERACVGEAKFSIHDAEDCWQRGFIEALFEEVDTKEQERWTYILNARE
jgi:uncharacterized membrane protein